MKNHPLDLFGAKASQENIPSVLERFFELKVALNDGLPSYICRCCHHKEVKFQEFFRKNTFSRQQQESVLRVKRGKTTAESPSGRSPQTRRDLKKSRTYEIIYGIYTMANIASQLENTKHVGKTVRKMLILIPQLEGPSSQELI